ncbi:hypothetical protein H9Q74_008771 [Fusarium xylarioides]|nr:hypothetical protein H9Q71_010882 [Fusarium xylarioides]KAG5820588.1 hypothetical protein H9Q74_008771 [Fusarium xylarioides]
MHIPSLLFSILGLVSIASAFPSRISKPERPFPRPASQKLDANADKDSLRYQPAFYFDKRICNLAAAVDENGAVNTGIPNGTPCRARSGLASAKVYTRKRCNNGWCAYMYDYYVRGSDLVCRLNLNRPNWENIVVFVKNNTIQHVAASANGEYIRRDKPHLHESHPLMVKQSPVSLPSCVFRFANKKHVENVKKDVGEWLIADLVGWDGSPTPELRKKLSIQDLGHFHLADAHFAETLEEAAGEHVPGFDCGSGETKHMHKEKQKEKVKGKDKLEVEEKDSEKKFDVKETVKGKDKLQVEEKDQKIESGKEKEEDKKFNIKEDKDDKDDKKKFDIKEKEEEKKLDIKEIVKEKKDKEDEDEKVDIKKDKENKEEKKEDKKHDEKDDEKDD